MASTASILGVDQGSRAMAEPQDPNVHRHPRREWVLPGLMSLVASSPAEGWAVGSAVILRGSMPDFHRHEQPASSVAFNLGGRAVVECKTGGRLTRFTAVPGGFSIAPAASGSAYRFDRPLESLNLAIQPSQLQAIADREFRPYSGSVDLVQTHHSTRPEVVSLGQAFAALLRAPRPGNRLYSESLWTQIAVQLIWNFSSLPRQNMPEVQRLPDARFRRVIDYLEDTLHEEISLSDLAEVAALSPNHFGVAFKKATGKSPHRYRTERRIARACELLSNPAIPIVSVALRVGFSSQSHFTTVFGRFMKTTPAAYRAQVLGR